MFLPRPYPDELIGSVLARGTVHTGLPPKVLNRLILGRPNGQVSFFLPSGLPEIARMTRVDSEELALRHTILPYVTAFMSPRQALAMRSKVLGPPTDEPGSLASLIKSVTQGTRLFRVCELCIRDDVSRFGEGYWHRSHFLPGVYSCSVHGSPLRDADEVATARPGAANRLADIVSLRTSAPSGLPGRALLSELAGLSLATLADGWRHREDWFEIYRDQATEKGYRLSGGTVAGGQLTLDLVRQYGQHFLAMLGCHQSGRTTAAWPSLMVRPATSVPFSPVKHSLISGYLASCTEETKVLSYAPPGKKPADATLRDEACARALQMAWATAASNGSRLTVRAVLDAEGAWTAFRHDRTVFPKTVALMQEFKRSDQAERQLGRRARWRRRLGKDSQPT